MRKRIIRYRSDSVVIDQPGWWCRDCGEALLSPADAAIAGKALASLKAVAAGMLTPEGVAEIRGRLNLTQRKAGEILGGGARAFQRYESGSVLVSQAMSNLLTLLGNHPDLLSEITEPPEVSTRSLDPTV